MIEPGDKAFNAVPSDDEVVLNENIVLEGEGEEKEVELSLVKDDEIDESGGGDPYNTADNLKGASKDFRSEKAANDALSKEANSDKAA